MSVTAVLLDVPSIQRFIFGSNKLRENEGASFLVERFFRDECPAVLETLELAEDRDYREGYIGGGNALFFFRGEEQELAADFIKELSRLMLLEKEQGHLKYSGLKLATACRVVPGIQSLEQVEAFTGENFKNFMTGLHEKLHHNRSQAPAVMEELGVSLNGYDKLDGMPQADQVDKSMDVPADSRYRNEPPSSVTMAKLLGQKKARSGEIDSNRKCEDLDKFPKKIQVLECSTRKFNKNRDGGETKFEYPKSFEEIFYGGGEAGEGKHLAIVHIDGNNMGERFRKEQSIDGLGKLSKKVEELTKTSFQEMLVWLMEKFDSADFRDEFNIRDNSRRLPIVPIIIGGDDVTFVTDARLGIFLAEEFLKRFSQEEHMSACAGVAVTKAKFPFYRGVQLAEELCANAKKTAREYPDSSWIDIHHAYAGFSGNLAEIREENFKVSQGWLYNGPYWVAGKADNFSWQKLETLKKGVRMFANYSDEKSSHWPRSQVKALRRVLTESRAAQERFLAQMNFRGRKFPDVDGNPDELNDSKKLWIVEKTVAGENIPATPYFDMVEMMEFMPSCLLKEEGK